VNFFTILGLIGVAINLVAYGLLSAGRMKADEARYQIINIVGTTGILLSLIPQWNLPIFVSNAAWLVIGIFGLTRIIRLRRTA
jgi:hypothetical protein